MKITLALLTATTAFALAGSAYAAEDSAKAESKIEYKDDGGYESKVSAKRKTADGTVESTKTNVDVDVDSEGHVKKKVKTVSETDPKGLMNKQKATTESKVEEKDRGGYEKTTKSKSTDAEGTSVSTETKVDVDVDRDGNVEEKVESKKVVDPKGLLNKTKTTSETKTVNGETVEKKTDSK